MTERDESLDGIIEILREPAPLAPDLTERVMAEVVRLPRHGSPASAPGLPWWRRQWTIRLTPLGGLALAAGLAALVLAGRLVGRGPAAQPPVALAAGAAAGSQPTQFVFVAPEASVVMLVGDFNDWNMTATPLTRAEGDGVWHVTVPLAPGRYRYTFVVDSTVWRSDPEAPSTEDEYGRPNSVVTIGGA